MFFRDFSCFLDIVQQKGAFFIISYKLHLIRAGATSDDRMQKYLGQSNPDLDDEGRRALLELSRRHKYPRADTVCSSPLSRSAQTAEILYPNVETLTINELADMNLGQFEGKTFEELRDVKSFTLWLDNSAKNAPPGGETADEFNARVINALDGVLRSMMKRKTNSAAIITHGGVIMALMAAIALPRLPPHRWAVSHGCGYTLLTDAQMWMRGRCAEVFGLIPE